MKIITFIFLNLGQATMFLSKTFLIFKQLTCTNIEISCIKNKPNRYCICKSNERMHVKEKMDHLVVFLDLLR